MKQKIGPALLLAFVFSISTAMADTCSIPLNRDLSFTLPHAVYDGNGSQDRSFFHIAFQYSGEHNGFQTWQPVNIGTTDPSSSCNTPIYSDLSFAIPDAVYHAGDPVESISMYLGFEYAGGQRWRLVDFSTNHDSPELPSMGQTHANSLGMLFLRIPAGTFMMGSPPEEPDRGADEALHRVTLTKDFYLQTTEVTQGQWEAVMGSNPSHFTKCGSDCPVEKVSWNDVQQFIARLNQMGQGTYALPTEAQWEYAARAGTTTPYAFGSCLSTSHANHDGNYPLSGCNTGLNRKTVIPVGSLSANAWGLFDMHGNVYEWVADWHADYPSGDAVDPVGPSSGVSRVSRGGSWHNRAGTCRSASRLGSSPDFRYQLTGFRLVLSSPAALGVDKQQIQLAPGESESIAVSGGTGNYTSVNSSNVNVADVTLGGRTITIRGIADGTATVTVKDSGGNTTQITVDVTSMTCTYDLSSSSGEVGADGGSQYVTVTASDESCSWDVSENLPWVTVSPASGTGIGVVSVTVNATIDNSTRSGSISIAGQTYVVEQDGLTCSFSLSSFNGEFPASGGNEYVSVTASDPACEWETATALSWVTVLPAKGTGSGGVSVHVEPNTGTKSKTGSVTIGGKPYHITQGRKFSGTCGAYVAPGVWQEFDCYNLAAIGRTTGDDPFAPSWRLNGGYWQWGRKGPDPGIWHHTNSTQVIAQFAHGPTGPDAADANADAVSGWDQTSAPDGAWSDSQKTENDPCPAGFRIPTISQWEGVLNNNSQAVFGTWSGNIANYTSVRYFGNDLMLPAAGYRNENSGALSNRGNYGLYWSSSVARSHAGRLRVKSYEAHTYFHNRTDGFSIRCIAE